MLVAEPLPPDPPASDFAPVPLETWRAQVERELAGEPFEATLVARVDGVELPALLAGVDPDRQGFPGLAPWVRGTSPLPGTPPWQIAVELAEGDDADLVREVEQGAHLLWLRGHPPAALAARLAGVDLATTAVVVESADSAAAASALRDLAAARGVAPERLRGGPLGPARDDAAVAALAAGVARCGVQTPGWRTVLLDASAVAGGPVEELAAALGQGVGALRRLGEAGLAPELVAAQVVFAVAVGRDLFVEIAKLRALRLLWAKALAVVGAGGAPPPWIHARSAPSSVRGPESLLRATADGFAAVIGGAASVALAAPEAAATPAASRRLGVNVQHLLAEEARLGAVLDPAGGSGVVERLTDGLARAAWRRFEERER